MVRATGNSQMSVVKWFLGIVLWFARIAEITILWSLRQWAYFVSLPCIGLVLLAKWVAFTLTKPITGLHLSLLGYIPQPHLDPLWAFGRAALFVFARAALDSQPHFC